MNPLAQYFIELDGVLNELSSWVDDKKLSQQRRQIIAQTCDLVSRGSIVLGASIDAQLRWLQIGEEECQEEQK